MEPPEFAYTERPERLAHPSQTASVSLGAELSVGAAANHTVGSACTVLFLAD